MIAGTDYECLYNKFMISDIEACFVIGFKSSAESHFILIYSIIMEVVNAINAVSADNSSKV